VSDPSVTPQVEVGILRRFFDNPFLTERNLADDDPLDSDFLAILESTSEIPAQISSLPENARHWVLFIVCSWKPWLSQALRQASRRVDSGIV